MEKTRFYYLNLPEGFKEKKIIDAKNKTTATIFTLLSFVLAVVVIVLLLLIKKYDFNKLLENRSRMLLADLAFLASLIIYIVLHELTHGIGFLLFTREKLKFGMTLTVAYCGVPSAYVKKWPAFITTLLPFFVYSALFLLLVFLSTNIYIEIIAILLFGFHFGGCVGDLYVASYLLFKADKTTVMNDDGAKQVFYSLSQEKEEPNA